MKYSSMGTCLLLISACNMKWKGKLTHDGVFFSYLCLYHHRDLYEFHTSCLTSLFHLRLQKTTWRPVLRVSDDRRCVCYEHTLLWLFYSKVCFCFCLVFIPYKHSYYISSQCDIWHLSIWSKSADIQLQEFNRLGLLFSIY